MSNKSYTLAPLVTDELGDVLRFGVKTPSGRVLAECRSRGDAHTIVHALNQDRNLKESKRMLKKVISS